MELVFLEDSGNKVKIEIKGENHTIANPLVKELWNDKNVKAAGYQVKHSLQSNPILVVETDGEKPKTAIKKAIERLDKKIDDFSKNFKSIKL